MKSTKGDGDSKKTSKSSKGGQLEESPPKSRGRASPARSPARSRKPSPGPRGGRKSPSRKSPSRKSPSRKSPSRKSPSRKSPSRSSKDEAPKSPSRRPTIKMDTKSEVVLTKLESTKLAQAQRRLADLNGGDSLSLEGVRERKVKSNDEPSSESKIASRRSIRLKMSKDYEKLLALAQSTKLPKADKSSENFSDDDDDDEDDGASPSQKKKSRLLLTPTNDLQKSLSEFGGRIGVVLQLFIFISLVFGINIVCNKSQCSFTSMPNLQQFKNLNLWFSWRAAAIYSSYLILHFLISLIPCCGVRVILPDSGKVFVANGLFSASIFIITMLSLEYFNVPIFQMIYREYYALLTVSMVAGVLLAVGIYIKSRKVSDEDRNAYGNTGYFIYDLWSGREINPVIFGRVNIKLITLRASLVACILLNLVYLYTGASVKNFPILSNETLLELQTYKQIAGSVSVNVALFVFVSFQVLYYVHTMFSERGVVSTFEYQYEGTGLMLTLGYAVYPFSTSVINKCILEHNIAPSKYIIAFAVVLYVFGFYIYHTSNSQKYYFRANPMDPKLAHLDSIPTFYGKRLLVSGWWGFVRHPNYLGDIIIHLSWAAAVLTLPAVICVVFTILFLASRARRDGERCRKRYGAAWERYCRRVPYNLVPKVY